MDFSLIQTALGQLQEDPDVAEAWATLRAEVQPGAEDLTELLKLLGRAREAHLERGEWEAAASLAELEVCAATDRAEEKERLLIHARLLREELLDDEGAEVALLRLKELGAPEADTGLDEIEARRARWQELRDNYAGEVEGAPDDVYRASMLMRAAEVELRYGQEQASPAVVERLEQAVRLDPTNGRAVQMLELVLRRTEQWEPLARLLARFAERAEAVAERVAAGLRLGRLFDRKLADPERAARAFDRVLSAEPSRPEAARYLANYYEKSERWSDLAAMYERALRARASSGPEALGDIIQIAMLHWRKRERPDDAEPWFEQLRKLEPASPLVLNFYREYCGASGDEAQLLSVLQGAHRVMPDGPDKIEVGTELGRLAEGQANAQKAIEQYKAVLRQDPNNEEAREALKRLYRQTEGYTALVELLRQQLERLPADHVAERVAVLREVAKIYRNHLKSDTALVSVLHQIVQLDERVDASDVLELRELVALYEKLGRWRDLLMQQQKLAEVTPDPAEKLALLRAVARRWLEQFSNAQNATEAYEQLLALSPDDSEARERLEELYRKRRAWPALFALLEGQLAETQGSQRILLLRELAQLAAERLNRGADAIALYMQILALDPAKVDVLDAVEKQAERAKDYATLSEVLERRVQLLGEDPAALTVLQKLGGVYADQLGDAARAAATWRRVLELSPGHARALRTLRDTYLASGDLEALEELYGSQADWDGLADVLSSAADKAKEPAQKIELSYRAAAIFEERLEQPERAVRSYERVLSADPTDARAAGRLLPLYERDEKWARLPALYEVLLASASSDEQRLELLGRLIGVTGDRLGDRRAAVRYARDAWELAPESDAALELFERSARDAGSWEGFTEALEQRLKSLPAAPEPALEPAPEAGKKGKKGKKGKPAVEASAPRAAADPQRRMLELKLAAVYADELGRVDDAIATYKRLLELEPADADAASQLEALLRRADRRDELRWLLELRVDSAQSEEQRVALLSDWAALEEDVFEAPEQATALYRRVLEAAPSDPLALRALPRLLLAAGDAAGAAEVLERHRAQLSGDDLASRELDLTELYLTRLGRPTDALAAALRVLELRPGDERALAALEQLMQLPETRAGAARVLADHWAACAEAPREAAVLAVLLEETRAKEARLELYARLAELHEGSLEDYGKALDVLLAAVREYPEQLELWERIDSLAVLAGRSAEVGKALERALSEPLGPNVEAELCERAAGLYEDRLGDPLGATPYLERALAREPGNERAFTRLKAILTGAERWRELEAMYERAIAASTDALRRGELLNEVALVSEEIIDDPAKATAYYERILELDPQHAGAIRALDRLYLGAGAHEQRAALLERQLELVFGEELLDLKLRLAEVQLTQLGVPERALPHVSDVLSERIDDPTARALAERLLETPALRASAARLLETVYEARDEVPELVRVLGVRLEELDRARSEEPAQADDQRDLLRRIARLKDERLRDDAGAFEAFARLAPADPLDAAVRERLTELGRRLGLQGRLAEVLTATAEAAEEASLRGEVLMSVAAIQEDLLGDPVAAEATYQRVLQLDPEDAELTLPAARALERLYVERGEDAKLVQVLQLQVRLEQDGDAKRALLGRIGRLSSEVLGDPKAAIEAWRARVEEDPSDADALTALDALYEATQQWKGLVEVLERRCDVEEDTQRRRELKARAARVFADALKSEVEAIDAWSAVVDEYGPDAESLTALERLLRAAERWSELEATLERHLEIVESDGARLDLLAQLGDLRRVQQGDVEGALETYRNALVFDPHHAASRAALEALLTAEERLTRLEAAKILHPIYESDGDFEGLLRVLDIEIETSDDPAEKLEGLRRATTIAAGPLTDPNRALRFAERGLHEGVAAGEPRPWVERLEQLAAETSRWADLVRIFAAVAPDLFDGELQLELTLRVAQLAQHQLQDRERARDYYVQALALRNDDRTALLALEELYSRAGQFAELLAVLERRAEYADSEQERQELLFRQAELQASQLEAPAKAIEVYEQILDHALEPRAVEALVKLYTAEGRFEALVELYQRQLDAAPAPSEAAALHVRIARIATERQQDVERAFDELEAALALEGQQADGVALLEVLLSGAPEPEHRARAASLLEPVYLARADYPKVMASLRARLEASQEPDERRDLLSRLAQLQEEQQEDYAGALSTLAQLLHEDLSHVSTLLELERLARVGGLEAQLAAVLDRELSELGSLDEHTAELAQRAGELFKGQGDTQKALAYYRRALAFAPESAPLFQAVDGLLMESAAHEERVALYREALDHRFEPEERLALLHVMGELERGRLGRPDDAIETYRQALDVQERDVKALDALTALYRERQRWQELGELLLQRAESAEDPHEGATHRLALARLQLGELAEPERAVDQLEEILRELPTHEEASKQLEALREVPELKERVIEILRPLYSSLDSWRHLIKLNEDRFALAQDPSDKVSVLRETASLWETRGNDPVRARRALGVAVRLDPEDEGVREDYERLAIETSAFAELADTYELVLSEHPGLGAARELLARLAQTYDTSLDDPRRALEAYARLHAVEPSELEPLEKMDRLATLLSDWPALVVALTSKGELPLEDEERASVWRRVGETKRDMLEDREGAIQAYERALEFEPDSAFTIDNLLELYEGNAQADPERLVELYGQRVQLTQDDDDARYALLLSSAAVIESKLDDRQRAIDVLGEALSVKPGDGAVLERLNALYRAEAMWPELLDNLKLQASTTSEQQERLALRRQIGALLAEQQQSPEEALEAYRLVLEELPGDAATVQAVLTLGEQQESLRSRVAELLVPALRETGRHAELVHVLELRLSTELEPLERAETLKVIAELQELRLGDAASALASLLRAVVERPEDDGLHSDIERLAASQGGWTQYAEVLLERAQSTFEPELGRRLWERLARVAEEQLEDDRRAVEALARAVELVGDAPELLAAQDRLLQRMGEHERLAEVLERRIGVEPESAAQAELHHRLGLLRRSHFKDPSGALSSFRAALDLSPSHDGAAAALEDLLSEPELFEEAAEILEGVYRIREQFDQLAALQQRRVDAARPGRERVELRQQLARILEEDCRDPRRAQQVLEAALVDDPSDVALLEELERLAPVNAAWDAAAGALARALEGARELVGETAKELYLRLAAWYRDHAGDAARAEAALRQALAQAPEADDAWLQLEQLQRAGDGRERELIETLRRRAKLQGEDSMKEQLLQSAFALAEELPDAVLAEAILRELLVEHDFNAWALEQLTRLRQQAGDQQETFELTVRRAELCADGGEARRLRHSAAQLARGELKDPARAIELYEQLFEDEPRDETASQPLRALYEEQGRWEELGRLLERLIDLADAAATRSRYRLELAQLNETRFQLPDAAIELLRAVLEDEPANTTAVALLSGLYERGQRDEELAELLTQQIGAAQTRGDATTELDYRVRLGELYDTKLGDRGRAIAAYEAVLERDGAHRGALTAVARLHAVEGRHAEAAAALERLLAEAPAEEAARLAGELADTYQRLADKPSAARALAKGLQRVPGDAELRQRLRSLYEGMAEWQSLAELYVDDAELATSVADKVKLLRTAASLQADKRGDMAARAALLDKASALAPDDRELLLELSDAYSASGRGKEAVAVLEKIVESFGGKRSKELGEIHRRLATAYLSDGDAQRAFEELDKAFRIEPGNIGVLKQLGEVAVLIKDWAKAQQMYRALLLQKLDDQRLISKAEVFLALGEVHLALGEKPKALQMLERAVQTDGSLERAKQRLAEVKG